jgi:flagellar hook-length control protein FliK
LPLATADDGDDADAVSVAAAPCSPVPADSSVAADTADASSAAPFATPPAEAIDSTLTGLDGATANRSAVRGSTQAAPNLFGPAGIARDGEGAVPDSVPDSVPSAASISAAWPAPPPGKSVRDAEAGSANGSTPAGSTPAGSGAAGSDAVAAQWLAGDTAGARSSGAEPRLEAPVGTAQFTQQLADHVGGMVDRNLGALTLQVNPSQLGPIELRVSVDGSRAQISLSAHSAMTCDALQSSAVRLREMLGAQGFAQVSVDVSQRSFQERGGQGQPVVWTPTEEQAAAGRRSAETPPTAPRTSLGALDAYA